VIQSSYRTTSRRSHTQNEQELSEPFYLRIPFINDQINRQLKAVFRRQGVRVRFCHPNRSLRNILAKKSMLNVLLEIARSQIVASA
jgi:hypothetical protein